MIEAVRLLRHDGAATPSVSRSTACLPTIRMRCSRRQGARVITSNSVPHETNAIDVAALMAAGIRELTA